MSGALGIVSTAFVTIGSMIIRQAGEALLLITQPDHAALAGRMMQEWSADGLRENPRRADILRAAAIHDNGWIEVDCAPVVDATTGQLQDFMTIVTEVKQKVWPRCVSNLNREPYVAALVAQHAVFVYDRYRTDPEWIAFFSDMELLREHTLSMAPPVTPQEFQQDYSFVRVGDLLSLTFCNNWTDAKTDSFGYEAQWDGSLLSIQPDPFGGRKIPIEVTARQLPNRKFTSAAAAAEAFDAAPQVVLSGTLSGKQ